MGMFLNSIMPFEIYKSVASETYFVDKTELIDELIPAIGKEKRFFCITRPRRFGKSIMANMVGAFFGNAFDSAEIFNNLKISKSKQYSEHLNKHNIIYIDFSEEPENCKSYEAYIMRILNGIKADLAKVYPEIADDLGKPVWDILTDIFQKTGHTLPRRTKKLI